MFEPSIALQYLIPRKKHLSVTLIALMSLGVISLVVWLLLVFLSVTEGMEKSWLRKLTDLNSPIRITPKEEYYSSYYYQIDSLSSRSGFSYKTIGEKLAADRSDPYDPEEDPEIPSYFPKKIVNSDGHLPDPVKGLLSVLERVRRKYPDLLFQDYEMSGGLLKLEMTRGRLGESTGFLTQATYLATPPSSRKTLDPLLVKPENKDIRNLLSQIARKENGDNFSDRIGKLLASFPVESITTDPDTFRLSLALLPEKESFRIYGIFQDETLLREILPGELHSSDSIPLRNGNRLVEGTLRRSRSGRTSEYEGKSFYSEEPLTVLSPLFFSASLLETSLTRAKKLSDLRLSVTGSLQGKPLRGVIPWTVREIRDISFSAGPPIFPDTPSSKEPIVLPILQSGETGILLPKSFRDNGALLGDKGYLSYTSTSTSGSVEMQENIFVAGFYDPGLLSVGVKCLLVPSSITRAINGSHTASVFDKISLNGFQIRFDDLKKTETIRNEIVSELEREGILSYWKVEPFTEYDFAKELMQQFQSDKYLFSLIGIFILLVACCNIVSFLILLVNDKKKEIAILQSMGASRKSIAMIFGLCGITVGMIGCSLGILAGTLTLRYIDTLLRFVSRLQGHDLFLQTFYGSSIPNTVESQAVGFLLVLTPLLSLLAGLIPAWKACRLHPSSVLRTET